MTSDAHKRTSASSREDCPERLQKGRKIVGGLSRAARMAGGQVAVQKGLPRAGFPHELSGMGRPGWVIRGELPGVSCPG